MIVIDASAMLEVLLRTSKAEAVEEIIFADGQSLHAPHLLDAEVTHVLRRQVFRGEIEAEFGSLALADLGGMPLTRHRHDIFLPRVWALRHNLTAYDAMYVALAEGLAVPLLTLDARIAATPGLSTPVIVP